MVNKSFFALILVFLAACSDNPLLGTWKLKSGQGLDCMLACKTTTFESDILICDGAVAKVDYEVRDSMVIVRVDKSNELMSWLLGDQALQMLDRNTYSAAAGQCKYGRYL